MQSTYAEWKAQVEKDLAGVPFEKALTVKLPEGIAVQPLYVDAPTLEVPGMPSSFSLVLREKSDEGFVTDTQVVTAERTLHLNDPLAPGFAEVARAIDWDIAGVVSTLALHEQGADAADELAYALASGAAAFSTLLDAGLTPERATHHVAVQISVGRDTFAELSKLRALRICWSKLVAIAGAPDARLIIHAVSSRRTLTQRDPWVNMLRTTTQVFAAVLGGADIVTPSSFDALLSAQSALGARVARNTGLVLRHESALGAVVDPAAGSYYLDTFTDQLAREAWKRFQAIEAQGGITAALPALHQRIELAWKQRLEAIAKRKTPLLGVSEFANLDEKLPSAPHEAGRHESEQFEALRARADGKSPQAVLVTLGTLAETRGRVGFAINFFGAGGIRAREVAENEKAAIACLCGTDERYASEAVERAKALKHLGCQRVLIAGKPGANEAELRAAGVDGFIYMGCDVVETLNNLLESYS